MTLSSLNNSVNFRNYKKFGCDFRITSLFAWYTEYSSIQQSFCVLLTMCKFQHNIDVNLYS